MIGFFPEIYPDELIYSWFARYYQRSGYSAYLDAIRDLYDREIIRPDVELINALSEDAKTVLEGMLPLESMILSHTMFPYYARFLPVERRRRAYEGMKSMAPNLHDLLAIPNHSKKVVRMIRYCPICAVEDREWFGETYIHRSHQMMYVDICYRHRCYLEETVIPISGKATPRLYVLETVIGEKEPRIAKDPLEIKLAGYVTDTFQADLIIDNPVNVGDFLHSRMAGTAYRSIRGQQRNMQLLYADYCEFYRDHLKKGITELWQIQKVLNGYRYNTFEICQIAMFLGIKVAELVNMKLPKKKQEDLFDERIRELHDRGLKYPAIAKILGASVNVVKPIGEGRYGGKKV